MSYTRNPPIPLHVFNYDHTRWIPERGPDRADRGPVVALIGLAAADPFITKVLGQELRDEFITYKSEEWRQYHQTVSQWEVDRYARLF